MFFKQLFAAVFVGLLFSPLAFAWNWTSAAQGSFSNVSCVSNRLMGIRDSLVAPNGVNFTLVSLSPFCHSDGRNGECPASFFILDLSRTGRTESLFTGDEIEVEGVVIRVNDRPVKNGTAYANVTVCSIPRPWKECVSKKNMSSGDSLVAPNGVRFIFRGAISEIGCNPWCAAVNVISTSGVVSTETWSADDEEEIDGAVIRADAAFFGENYALVDFTVCSEPSKPPKECVSDQHMTVDESLTAPNGVRVVLKATASHYYGCNSFSCQIVTFEVARSQGTRTETVPNGTEKEFYGMTFRVSNVVVADVNNPYGEEYAEVTVCSDAASALPISNVSVSPSPVPSPSIAPLAPFISPDCFEDDEGVNVYKFGSIAAKNGTWVADECVNASFLKEFYCANRSWGAKEVLPCPDGSRCSRGVCIPKGETCVDSDGGKNYFVPGFAQGIARSGVWLNISDECHLKNASGYRVVFECFGEGCVVGGEAFCDGDFIAMDASTNYPCQNGCKKGACLAAVPDSKVEPPSNAATAVPQGDVFTFGIAIVLFLLLAGGAYWFFAGAK